MESQAFYRAMGCREAEEYNQASVEKEPFDCQLELELGDTNIVEFGGILYWTGKIEK